ncbi:MAG: hypothetical protein IM638_10880 [Bacteroidetes bacterium]|nr:hypothetical protein [Bacteroidota bacterium]
MSGTPARTKSVTPTVTPNPPARQSNGEAQSGDGGKRMFRRMNGEMIELPADMSVFEAVRLEMEAVAAEKKHGKGQQPKPLKPKATVVTVQAAAAKAAQKAKPKGQTDLNVKKGKGGKKAGAAKNPLQAAAKGKVGKFLAMLGGPVLLRGVAKLAQLKANEQTHDDPLTKLGQTEKAVVPPALEGQSKSHGEQVEALNQKPAPEPKAEDASKAMLDSIQANMPQSIEDVDNFKRNGKGGHISRTVMNMVQGHTNSVTDTFGEMDKPRPPAPPTHTPEALPPEEIAPATPNLQLGAGAIAPLKPEHTDMSKFSKDSDDLLKKEEISQEQLDMVDSGDLAEANKDRKQLKKDVKDKPAAARKTAEHERKQVDTELQQEEQKGRGEIKNKRKQSLAATRGRQTGTKLTMQQKRQKVTDDIKAIYDKARNKVTTRLAELETQSMKRFDDGNATASKKFEDDVKREIEAFKDQRYSGFWGWAKKAKDWLLGMDELPEVNEIFQRNKGIFVDTMNKLVADITADNKNVIAECKAEIEGAKTEIAKYVKNLGPELKAEGESAMKEMTDRLNELDKEVDEKEKELAQKLQDKQKAAIKAIDEKIEKMKEEMSGALAKLGKLLLEAAKKFFTWALQKFGYSLSEIEGIINKGAKVLKAIFTKPIQFVKNLFNAADQGFQNFGKNFLTHLKNALFSWLTGSLTEVKLPESWDPKGIASVALQMVGISYQNIRKHLVKIIPEPVVEGMEKGFEIVKALITDGPMAAWDALKDMAGELKDAFVDAVKSWIKETIIQKAIEFVATLIIPGAGIIRAIVGIYDTIVFFIQKAKDIAQMIGNFMGSIGEIAMGNIGAAAGALENGLAQGLTLVISFLAKLIKLDGITAKIRAALAKIKDKVDGMMSKVAKWIKEKAGKLWGGVKNVAGSVKDVIFSWWKKSKSFKTKNKKQHKIFYKGENKNARLYVASEQKTLPTWLSLINIAVNKLQSGSQERNNAEKNITEAENEYNEVLKVEKTVDYDRNTQYTDAEMEVINNKIDSSFERISILLSNLFPLIEDDEMTLKKAPEITESVKSKTTKEPDRFNFIYSPDEMKLIVKSGLSLNVKDDVMTDMAFVGSRKDKIIRAPHLSQQMENWATIIQPRGYPYWFQSAEKFADWKKGVVNLLDQFDAKVVNINVQGSALRKPTAKDIDVSATATKSDFINIRDAAIEGFGGVEESKKAKNVKSAAEKGKIDVYNIKRKDLYNSGVKNDFKKMLRTMTSQYSKAVDVGMKIVLDGSEIDINPKL